MTKTIRNFKCLRHYNWKNVNDSATEKEQVGCMFQTPGLDY